ncbi:hypothetical protein KL920_005277 [Ogataea angusta]|nr:hypothetical protein KL920_005277 [Ogataea angusta]
MAGMTKNATPPPAFPQPAETAFAVPMILLSKNTAQNWEQQINEEPRKLIKKRMACKPATLVTKGTKAVGIAPASRTPTKVIRGPYLSLRGPKTNLPRRVPVNPQMLLLDISTAVSFRSFFSMP